MLDRRAFVTGAVLFGASLRARPARARDAAVRLSRPLDLVALPLIVMQHEHLIERVAEAMGLGSVSVAWNAPAKDDPLDALTRGDSDLVAADLAAFLLAADASLGKPQAVCGLGAVAQLPYVLVTRRPAVKTIVDFAAADRIAVPALKASGPAVMLEMAAAQEWGIEHYARLDPLTLARPDAAAADALLSGNGDIDAHFSRTPYADAELGDPAIHRVMDSFDIAGPHSAVLLATTTRFGTANPELCKAILSALQAADDFIAKTPGAAAEIFAATVKDEDIPLEALSDIIGDPDLAYRAAPAGLLRTALFMHRVGHLKHRPQVWQDWFLPAARDLKGS